MAWISETVQNTPTERYKEMWEKKKEFSQKNLNKEWERNEKKAKAQKTHSCKLTSFSGEQDLIQIRLVGFCGFLICYGFESRLLSLILYSICFSLSSIIIIIFVSAARVCRWGGAQWTRWRILFHFWVPFLPSFPTLYFSFALPRSITSNLSLKHTHFIYYIFSHSVTDPLVTCR